MSCMLGNRYGPSQGATHWCRYYHLCKASVAFRASSALYRAIQRAEVGLLP